MITRFFKAISLLALGASTLLGCTHPEKKTSQNAVRLDAFLFREEMPLMKSLEWAPSMIARRTGAARIGEGDDHTDRMIDYRTRMLRDGRIQIDVRLCETGQRPTRASFIARDGEAKTFTRSRRDGKRETITVRPTLL